MSFPDDPPDSAEARRKQNPLDSFATESTSPPPVAPSSNAPSAIDEVIRNVRLRASGDESPTADSQSRFRGRRDSLARYVRTHTPHLAAASAVALIAMGTVRWWPTIRDAAGTLRSQLASAVSSPAAPEAPKEEAPATSGPTQPVRSQRAPRPGQPADVPRVPGGSPSGQSDREAIAANPAANPAADLTRETGTPPPAPPTEDKNAVVDQTVYSSADGDVQPPTIRSVEPGQPAKLMNERTRLIEVLVRADGSVEQVQLRSPEARLLDAMLLSRAKMWQFEPARRAGRPVPYRLQLIWEPPP